MDLGYFRWDYLSLWFEMEPDRFHQHLEILENLAAQTIDRDVWKRNTKIKAHGDRGNGKRAYSFNAHGRAAAIVTELPPAWAPLVHRLDIKTWPEALDDSTITELRTTLLNGKSGYNVTGHNGRVRQKNDKRDAGGNSVSIGSHKSDLRVSLYKRAQERACIEFQVSGDMLARILKNRACPELDANLWAGFWLAVKDDLQQVGTARYNTALVNVGALRWRPTTREERIAAARDEEGRQKDINQEDEEALAQEAMRFDADAAHAD